MKPQPSDIGFADHVQERHAEQRQRHEADERGNRAKHGIDKVSGNHRSALTVEFKRPDAHHGLRIDAARPAARNITTRTSPDVRPRYCPSSSFTTDGSEGAVVAVVVGVGLGSEDGDGLGDSVEPAVGEGETVPGIAPNPNFALSVTDDVPGKGTNESGDKEGIHYRPQLMRTAMRTTAAVGRPSSQSHPGRLDVTPGHRTSDSRL